MSFPLRRCLLGLAVYVMGSAAFAQSSAQKPLEKVSLRYGFAATGADSIWTYGVEKGFFRDEGIDLELRQGKGSAVTAQTVAAGTDDFAVDIDAGTFLNLAAKGLPATAVFANLGKAPSVILSPASKSLKTPADLVGKRIATTPGGGPATLLPVLFKRNNIDPASVTLTGMQPGSLLTVLLTGNVDGVATNIVVKAEMEAKDLPVYALLYADFGVVTPGMYMITSNAFLQAKPDTVRRMVVAAQKSMIATAENPQAAADSFNSTYPNYDRKATLGETKIFIDFSRSKDMEGKPLGTISLVDARAGAEVLVSAGMMPPGVDVSKFVTNRFVPSPAAK